jgi:uncharacterized membrane protein (UPF0127 family)
VPSSRTLVPFLLALLLIGCGARPVGDDKVGAAGAPLPARPQAVFPSVTVGLELARTEPEHEKGLGGHAPLGARDGMLFIFDRPATYSFWMKGMTFALDMMWIDSGKVVHLERDVPPPAPGAPESSYPVYTPRAPALYVLEVQAGFAARNGIDVGTTVELRGL